MNLLALILILKSLSKNRKFGMFVLTEHKIRSFLPAVQKENGAEKQKT